MIEGFFDKNRIKVFDGIAGSGKSTVIDTEYSGMKYVRYTSTHRLARDTSRRFGCETRTIAGGLFTSEAGRFFIEERDPSCEEVVIDEVLQVDPRVFSWVEHHAGRYNISIATDTRQMLAPGLDAAVTEAFEQLLKDDRIQYIQMTKTRRARDEETRKAFDLLYRNVVEPKIDAAEYLKQFPRAAFRDLDYSPGAAFITHTREMEDLLYNEWSIPERAVDFNRKGFIAAKPGPVAREKYPCLSQKRADETKARSYIQAANVGTPTRWQGSEVEAGTPLFYFVERRSNISPRELYTVITRLHLLKDLRIVYMDMPERPVFTTFCGLPVKHQDIMEIETVPESSYDWDAIALQAEKMTEESPDTFYTPFTVRAAGKIMNRNGFADPKKVMSIKALLARDEAALINYTPEIYKALEAAGLDKLVPAQPKSHMFGTKGRYSLDLASAFLMILSRERVPCSGHIYDRPGPGRMSFYKVESRALSASPAVAADDLADYLENRGGTKTFLFSVNCRNGADFAREALAKADRSKEDKAFTKTLRWGIVESDFLTAHFKTFSDEKDFYIIDERNQYKLIMTALDSHLTFMMLHLKERVSGRKAFRVDEMFFNDDPEKIKEAMSELFPAYRYRIKDRQSGFIDLPEMEGDSIFDILDYASEKVQETEPVTIFQNYKDPPTKEKRRKIYKAEKERERRRKRKEERNDDRTEKPLRNVQFS